MLHNCMLDQEQTFSCDLELASVHEQRLTYIGLQLHYLWPYGSCWVCKSFLELLNCKQFKHKSYSLLGKYLIVSLID